VNIYKRKIVEKEGEELTGEQDQVGVLFVGEVDCFLQELGRDFVRPKAVNMEVAQLHNFDFPI